MTDQLTISIAQLNPTVGDIAGNVAKLRQARAEAAGQGADLVVGTELCIAGYPPEDLVLKPAFVAACEAALLDGGQVAALRFKHELPNYGVFDEKRVFGDGAAAAGADHRRLRGVL